MTLAVAITIFASFLWGITNHIDKYLLNGVDESGSSLKTLLVFSTLIAGIVISPIWLIICNFSVNISNVSLICVFLAATVSVLGIYAYFKALEKNDASIVVVMFQLIPVFSYILALLFLNETLTIHQIIGSIIIILSAILITIDFEEKNHKSKVLALVLGTLSSFLYATDFFLFDIAIRNSSYNSCAFWFQIGFLILGVFLICIKSVRTTFFKAIKNNGKKYFSLNTINEAINTIASLLAHYANLVLPVALVNVLNGFQGAFVFILGAIGVKLFPKYFTENLNKKVIFQKVGCIILSLIGLIVIFM